MKMTILRDPILLRQSIGRGFEIALHVQLFNVAIARGREGDGCWLEQW
jgi:hypothetical protein